jgi:ubiquinone/menaquinone biosynthesis C-methylase UbiE
MNVLYAESSEAVRDRTPSFDQHIEPFLEVLEARTKDGSITASVPEVLAYLTVCRTSFRRLEYAFGLDALLRHLQAGDRYLDAGCGVTPLAHAIARQSVIVDACDVDSRIVEEMIRLDLGAPYETSVTYTTQDLTSLSYEDGTFDAVSCISVLEHIPAPKDRQALSELFRVLKGGGLLVVTVDFRPDSAHSDRGRWGYWLGRTASLARRRDFAEVARGVARKVTAQRSVRHSSARQARSPNQPFDIAHLEQDILPLLEAHEICNHEEAPWDLRAVTPGHARQLWMLDTRPGDPLPERGVLPVGFVLRKAHVTRPI